MRCAVISCNSDNQSKKNPCNKNIKFFRFPKNSDLSKQWLHATKRKDKVNVENAVVCSKHFQESDYKVNLKHKLLNYTPKNYRGLKDDAIPSQNLFQAQGSAVLSHSTARQNRKHLCVKRQKAQLLNEIMSATDANKARIVCSSQSQFLTHFIVSTIENNFSLFSSTSFLLPESITFLISKCFD
ncbi:hypothetical protein RN001_000086 [Aquatica leii]|uniref:THAP-type domain-containing protein n=1 Tax=Aquatica leii TaxID=1421715 RepID=A0AAN7SSD7_9COLE|nr:hypothetical protein RN001_000086 [Aquatica leii]